MKQTAFWRQKNGDYRALLKYSVLYFLNIYIYKMKCLEVSGALGVKWLTYNAWPRTVRNWHQQSQETTILKMIGYYIYIYNCFTVSPALNNTTICLRRLVEVLLLQRPDFESRLTGTLFTVDKVEPDTFSPNNSVLKNTVWVKSNTIYFLSATAPSSKLQCLIFKFYHCFKFKN